MDSDSGEYSRLVEALRLCALPYAEQAGALPEFVFVPDEVVGEFDKAYRSSSDSAFLSAYAGRTVTELDRLFVEMTEATDREWVWSIEAIQRDARWARVRTLASKALALLGEPLQRPVFPGSTWVGMSDGESWRFAGTTSRSGKASSPRGQMWTNHLHGRWGDRAPALRSGGGQAPPPPPDRGVARHGRSA